jgi:hypothetical protein
MTFGRGKTHTDKCMRHIAHPIRLKFDASAASSASTPISVLPLYSAAITVIGPDGRSAESEACASGGPPPLREFASVLEPNTFFDLASVRHPTRRRIV